MLSLTALAQDLQKHDDTKNHPVADKVMTLIMGVAFGLTPTREMVIDLIEKVEKDANES